MLEILSYTFFQNALIGGLMIALIASVFGVFVVMRKESNIAHSISNFIFLGIGLSLLLQGDYYVYAAIFAVLASILIYVLERTKVVTNESSKELISQGGMAGGIFVLSLIATLQLDINSLLFGSILAITHTDIWMIGIFGILFFLIFGLFGRNFLAVTLNENIAKTKGIHVGTYNFLFLLLLSFFIALSIKVFGILLIGAFLVIPANSAKVIGKNLKQMFTYSIIFSITGLLIGLFSSYYIESSTGATIVLSLLAIFVSMLVWKRVR